MLNLWSDAFDCFDQEEGGEAEAVTQLMPQGAVLGVVVLGGVVTWIVATTTEGEAMAFISVVHDKAGLEVQNPHKEYIQGNISQGADAGSNVFR